MTHIPSNSTLAFDSSSVEFLQSATDIGEVIALLAGRAPDPDRLSRLCVSLRGIQTYLIDGARERSRFESVDDDILDELARRTSAAAYRAAGSVREALHASV